MGKKDACIGREYDQLIFWRKQAYNARLSSTQRQYFSIKVKDDSRWQWMLAQEADLGLALLLMPSVVRVSLTLFSLDMPKARQVL